jgi:hypothetical protein
MVKNLLKKIEKEIKKISFENLKNNQEIKLERIEKLYEKSQRIKGYQINYNEKKLDSQYS